MVLIFLTLVTLSVGAVSAVDADAQANDDIGISNITSQNSIHENTNELIQEDIKTDESTDVLASSNEEDLLAGEVGMSVVGGQKESYTVGETVYLKLGTEKSSYTPADIYVQVQGGGYTDNPVGTYSEATSAAGVPYTFQTAGNVNLRFVQINYGTYYFSDYMTFNVVEAGQSVAPGTFTDLKSLIDSSEGILELPYDFTYDSEYDSEYVDGVLVDKDITIKGNGHTIDAANLAKIFDVYKANVVLDGVTLINGKSDNGGAIIVSNSLTGLTIKNSIIKDCVSNQGGAIHLMSGGSLTVEETTFTNNSAKSGGAIYINSGSSTVNVKDSLFSENKATSTGTAGGGAAIHVAAGNLIVDNSDFNDNVATSTGGAINTVSSSSYALTVTDSRFNRNSAIKGGAVYVNAPASVTINDDNFTENTASDEGGAVYIQHKKANVDIDGVEFIANSAKNAGAVASKLATTTIENAKFEDNTATSQGGALFTSGSVAVNGSSFKNNGDNSFYQAGTNSLSVENSELSAEVTSFNVGETYGFGSEIAVDGTFTTDFNNAISAVYVIDTVENTVEVADGTFTINLGSDLLPGDHAIVIKSFVDSEGNTYIVGAEKTFNVLAPAKGSYSELAYLIKNADGVLDLPYDFAYNASCDSELVDGVLVDKSITINGNGHTVSGENLAKIFDVWKADVVITNITLANGKSNDGGAIVVSNSITSLLLKDSVIKDSSSNQGGAIHIMSGTVTVENTTFTNNTAKSGGAIYHNAASSTLTIKDSTFEDNKATSTGTAGGAGAIQVAAGKLVVDNTDFNDNTAVSTGGAINVVNSANAVIVTGSRFNRNSASDGGAVHVKATTCTLTVTDSNFTENSASGQGGAIYTQYKGVTTNIDNVIFAKNTAKDGAALVNKLGTLNIEKATFEDNVATNQGGAIFASGKVIVNESSFANNQATTANNVYQTSADVVSIENTIIAVPVPSLNVEDTYENGENIVISGTFESGMGNDYFDLSYTLDSVDATATLDKGKFNIELGSELPYGDHTISIKSFTDEAGNTYSFETVEKTFTVKREVKTASDLQDLIDNAEEGAVIELGNYSFENISNVNITKNITIKGSPDTTISSAGDGNPIFNVPAKSENGPSGFTITDVTFLVNNGDTIVKVTADNATDDENAIDNPEININNNTFTKANDDVVGKSVTVLELDSERTNLAPTNAINISGNKLDDDIKAFQFEITSLSDGDGINIPSIYDKQDNGTNGSDSNATVKVPTTISAPNKSTTAIDTKVDGKKGAYYQLTLKDNEGLALADKEVKVILDNVVYTLKTDANGIAKLQLNIKKSGTYTLFAIFLGDDKYNNSFASAKIKVNKQKMKLSVSKKKFKVKAKRKVVKVTLKTSKGKAIKGKKVTLKVKGKTYKAKTNKKGVAKIKIKLKKRGTFKGTIKVPKDNTYKKLTKKIKIKIK